MEPPNPNPDLPIRIDTARSLAHVGDRQVKLTRTELRLLACLLSEPGRTFSRQELMDAAIAGGAIVGSRTIDQHIYTLRRKIGSELIESVRGAGYRFGLHQ